MDTRYVQSFVIVVECGSFAAAARLLDLTSAAVAARIKALEEELGTPVVKRAGHSVRPTQAGLRILDRARDMVRDARDLRAIANGGATPGELRLGVFVSALTSLLPPVLERLYAIFPDLAVFVTPGASVELVRRVGVGELDLAVVVEPQFVIPKTCEWSVLTEQPLVVVAQPIHAGKDPHQLMRSEPFIRYDRSVLGGQLADRYLRDHGIRPRVRLEIDGVMAIAALVHRGLGVSLLPDLQSLWAPSLSIECISLPDRAPTRRIGLVWCAGGPHAALARAFLSEAETMFGSR